MPQPNGTETSSPSRWNFPRFLLWLLLTRFYWNGCPLGVDVEIYVAKASMPVYSYTPHHGMNITINILTSHFTQRMRNVLWLFIQGNAGLAYIGCLQPNISVTVAVRKKVSTVHLYETTYRGKNDHVTDDFMWPRKVKTMIQILLSLNISKSLGDRVSTNGTPIGNAHGQWNGHMTNDIMWPWRLRSRPRYV